MEEIEAPAFVTRHHGLAGKFITFEGCEGSGKTTQARLLHEHLLEQGRDAILCHEPGGTPLGERIREVLLDPARSDMVPAAEALLFTADRAQEVAQVIRPALARGWIVIPTGSSTARWRTRGWAGAAGWRPSRT